MKWLIGMRVGLSVCMGDRLLVAMPTAISFR